MKQMILCGCAALTAAALAGTYLAADQDDTLAAKPGMNQDEGGIAGGPQDVTVSRLGLNSSGSGDDFNYYGSHLPGGEPESMRIRAFSAASTSCNIGGTPAQWFQGHSGGNAGKHPVIAQNVYRLLDGKFEQIGQSWLKHSFCAVSEPTCGQCQSTGCSTLGVGCADTYWATLNGDHFYMGPRHEINPWPAVGTATHTASPAGPDGPTTTVEGRLWLRQGDIDAGGLNVYEIQYVTHDEQYMNRYNNASWRPVNVSNTNISGIGSGQASVRFQQPGIQAWKENDAAVQIVNVEAADNGHGDGRFHVGYRVYDNGDDTYTYEFAVHNMNSRRGANSFTVPLRPGVILTDIGFHDVEYHSGDGMGGENFDGTDWEAVVNGNSIVWSTDSYDENDNANALRWGTLYNFRFTANSAPVDAALTMGMYLPSQFPDGPDSTSFFAVAPDEVDTGEPCDSDTNGDEMVDVQDMVNVILAWGTDDAASDVDGSGLVDVNDLVQVILDWGACP